MLELNKIYCGANSEILKQIDSETINCCITSPSYWALRDYGIDGQLGLEPTFEEYINKLCNIFDEVKRVLRKDGTCWIVIGDSYSANRTYQVDGTKQISGSQPHKQPMADLPNKCLIMIPFHFAIEMVNRGWILRNTIIWYKPNCMPASVKVRFTVDFEYVFFFVKNKKYWFEQQFEPAQNWGIRDRENFRNGTEDPKLKHYGLKDCNFKDTGRNKRAVWQVTTKTFKSKAHFAKYPEELIEPMIKAGCLENGIVLDPFMGSGTTGVVAKKLNRNFIGIEINPNYVDIANKRLANTYRQSELIK